MSALSSCARTRNPRDTGGQHDTLHRPILEELRTVGREPDRFLEALLTDFVDEASSLMAEIDSASAAGRYSTVAWAAHQLGGVSGLLGALPLAAASEELHRSACSEDGAGVRIAVASIRREIGPAIEAASKAIGTSNT